MITNEILLLNKRHTDVLIKRTKNFPQETFGFKLNTQMKTHSFSSPIKPC